MKHLIILFVLFISFSSCKKFLDEKPDASLVVPSSLDDLQKLLDRNQIMNTTAGCMGESSADNYYLKDADWTGLSEQYKNLYAWGDEIFFDQFGNDWSNNYSIVYYANLVLEYLDKIPFAQNEQEKWNNLKGSALLFRGKAFSYLVQTYSKAWDENSSSTDLGIPLRLDADFNKPSVRASVQQSYQQAIADLTEAIKYLPVSPVHKMRPSRPAAYAFLARTYLSMRDYNKAQLYADSCLQLYNSLLNYNSLTASASFPVAAYNDEVVMHTLSNVPTTLSQSKAKVDSILYNSYAANDLRKTVFFKSNGDGTYAYKGSYTGSTTFFTGIAVDEIFLIRAECFARLGNVVAAMNDLNTVMIKRWKTGTFVPFAASTVQQAVSVILSERRKELPFRDLRWSDIKRLNKEGETISVSRKLNGQQLQLSPNDPRFALPLPRNVIALTGMPQNPR